MLRLVSILCWLSVGTAFAGEPWLKLPGTNSKHIVFISGDEEYRSEEALPQLAKILNTHHGFTCTVLFAIDKKDGFTLNPNETGNIPGLEALKTADLMVLGLRFRNLPDEQMKHIEDYVNAGKPIVGLRTSTHAFNMPKSEKYAKYHWQSKVEGWQGGFGKTILGETWVAHHGQHGKEGTRGRIVMGEERHPILKGIKDGEIFGTTDVYTVKLPLPGDSRPLVLGEVTETLKPDSKAVAGKKNDPMMPVAWVKSYPGANGKGGLVFTTTMGASQDLEFEATRRMIVNACYWALGREGDIAEKSKVDIVGEFKPSMFKFRKQSDWMLDAITTRMKEFVAAKELSGVVTMVGRKNSILHHDAVGFANIEKQTPMTKDTMFRIASMTKPMTAVGVMMLVDEGKLSPDDAVEKYLAEFKGQKVKAGTKESPEMVSPKRPLLVRDLLTHTGGLPNYPGEMNTVYSKRQYTLKQTTEAIAKEPMMFEPGTKWSYCNPGIDTLGRLIEVISGQSYESFMQARIFEPLGMKQSTFFPTPEQAAASAVVYGSKNGQLTAASNLILELPAGAKHPVPAGGLYSTAADVAKFFQCMLNKGELGGKRILSEKSFAEMTKNQIGTIKGGFGEGMTFGYGFAVIQEPKGATAMLSPGSFGHGGAFGTQSWADPKQDVFMILLIASNGTPGGDGSKYRSELQRYAVEAITRK